MTGHVSLLHIATGLSNINVLSERQSIVLVPNTSILISPTGADYLLGNAAKLQPKFVRLREVLMVRAIPPFS